MVSSKRFALHGAGVAALLASCQVVLGIEDKQLDPGPSTGGTAGTAGAAGTGAGGPSGADPVPPARPPGAPVPGGGATRWFAAKTLFLGTYDPETKKPDTTAWRRIGHDVDGECTTINISKSNSSAICSQPASAPPESLEDGDGCRDNSAGRLLAVGIQVVPINFEPQLHADLLTGETATYLLRLDDLADGPDDPYVRGALYVSVPRNPALEKPPSWDGFDQFAVDVATVESAGAGDGGTDAGDAAAPDAGATDSGAGDAGYPIALLDKPLFVFDKGYLSENVWVSGDLGKSPMKVPLFVFDRLSVVDTVTATLTLGLSAQHDQAKSSQLSVAVATPAVESHFRPIARELVSCVAPLENLMMESYVLPARDLGPGPSLKSPGVPCDTLSLAFAFEWKPVKPPVSVLLGPVKPPKCGDGGT
jgi:hypothetical protein